MDHLSPMLPPGLVLTLQHVVTMHPEICSKVRSRYGSMTTPVWIIPCCVGTGHADMHAPPTTNVLQKRQKATMRQKRQKDDSAKTIQIAANTSFHDV